MTGRYIQERRQHFRYTFSQHVALLLLYAVASALLLGVGGILVLRAELTIGQLVAAELVLTAVFYGLSRAGYYLQQCYKLFAALEEISLFFDVPLEAMEGTKTLDSTESLVISYRQAAFTEGEKETRFNFEIESGKNILISCQSQSLEALLLDTLKYYRKPDKGSILVNDHALEDYDVQHMRGQIIIQDRPTIVECTVEEYLQFASSEKISATEMNHVLALVELDQKIASLPQGLATSLTVTGLPLSLSETLRLKLALALLSKPKILVLTELFDMISTKRRRRILVRLCDEPSFSVLYVSNRIDVEMFDDYLYVGAREQIWLPDANALRSVEESNVETAHD